MSRDYEDLVMEASMLWHELGRLADACDGIDDDPAPRRAAVQRAREVIAEVLGQRNRTRRRRGSPDRPDRP